MSEKKVFISYSHEDKKWRDDLDKHLKPYLRAGAITSWSDEQIVPGSQWFEEIKSALAQTKVAVLLVSSEFLASDFIHEHELGPLLKKTQQGGANILWVPVSASSYEKTPLKGYQALLDPEKPMDGMADSDREKAWVEICKKIEKAVKASNEPFSIAPPVTPEPSSKRHLFVISWILVVVIIVASVLLVTALRNMDHSNVQVENVNVGNEVKIGDQMFLRSWDGNYVIAASSGRSNWPRLKEIGKVPLKFLGTEQVRNGSKVRIQSLEQFPNGENVLVAAENHRCYYQKRASDDAQEWKILKVDATEPVLHYRDQFYLENVQFKNKRLGKDPDYQDESGAGCLTIKEDANWWTLEKK
jgi:hypothetical protein